MFTLKRLPSEGIPAAMAEAAQHRLLGELEQAHSVCLDVLRLDPCHQPALRLLLRALTDRPPGSYAVGSTLASEVLPRITDAYERALFAGLIEERRAHAQLVDGHCGSRFDAYASLREAMERYDEALKLRPPANDEALLRWNACARIIDENHLEPRPREGVNLQSE